MMHMWSTSPKLGAIDFRIGKFLVKIIKQMRKVARERVFIRREPYLEIVIVVLASQCECACQVLSRMLREVVTVH